MRYVTLKAEEITALELSSEDANALIRKRSQCLLLSNQGRTIIDLASIFDVDRRTIERWINSWSISGVDSLPILPGRGVKTRLKGLEEEITKQLELNSRNLKSVLLFL